ncbi:MAG: hypothetical protein ACP5P1_13950 [Acidimicrobiales bacterium]
MTLAGLPSRRRGAGLRWITVGVVVTILILLIDASLKSKSPTPTHRLAVGAWVDKVLPAITSSTTQGQVIASIWSGGLSRSAPTLAATIDGAAAKAVSDYTTVSKLDPPSSLGGSAGLLEASLLARSQAASTVQKVLLATLGAAAGQTSPGKPTDSTAAPPSAEAPLLAQAASDIAVGDQAYQLFLSTFPASAGVKMPPSAWGSNLKPYQTQPAQIFLTSLQSAVTTSPLYQLSIFSVSLSPSPITTSGSTLVLPDTSAISVDLVVADTGNQPASHVTVTATISPASSGSSTVKDFVNLAVGQAYAISGLGPLSAPKGTPVTLTVTADVTPPPQSGTSGSQAAAVKPATTTLTFEMPAPPAPTTSTTSPGTRSAKSPSTTSPAGTNGG